MLITLHLQRSTGSELHSNVRDCTKCLHTSTGKESFESDCAHGFTLANIDSCQPLQGHLLYSSCVRLQKDTRRCASDRVGAILEKARGSAVEVEVEVEEELSEFDKDEALGIANCGRTLR